MEAGPPPERPRRRTRKGFATGWDSPRSEATAGEGTSISLATANAATGIAAAQASAQTARQLQ